MWKYKCNKEHSVTWHTQITLNQINSQTNMSSCLLPQFHTLVSGEVRQYDRLRLSQCPGQAGIADILGRNPRHWLLRLLFSLLLWICLDVSLLRWTLIDVEVTVSRRRHHQNCFYCFQFGVNLVLFCLHVFFRVCCLSTGIWKCTNDSKCVLLSIAALLTSGSFNMHVVHSWPSYLHGQDELI